MQQQFGSNPVPGLVNYLGMIKSQFRQGGTVMPGGCSGIRCSADLQITEWQQGIIGHGDDPFARIPTCGHQALFRCVATLWVDSVP